VLLSLFLIEKHKLNISHSTDKELICVSRFRNYYRELYGKEKVGMRFKLLSKKMTIRESNAKIKKTGW